MDTAYREEAEPSIRGKIEIYAKWRRSGNDGMIRLRYEARNGDAPADPNYYTDQGDAFIAPAPENVAGEDQFLYWTFKGGKYYPGQIFVVEADDAEKATYDGEEANWITFAAVYGTPTTAPTTTIKIDLLGGGMLKDSYVATLRTEVESSGATVTKEDNGNVTIKNIPLNQEFTLPELDDVENLKRGYVFDDCWTTQEGVKTEDATFDAGAKVAGDLNDRPTNPDENTVYAFWNKYFYIYHSGDGSWENVPVFDTKERNEYTKEGIYNPFSLLNTFDSQVFRDYWFETGTPSFLVYQLQKTGYPLDNMTEEELSADTLNSIDVMDVNPLPLLYQSGYLTIKDYDPEFKTYRLGFPNREVREGFIKYLYPFYTPKTQDLGRFAIVHFIKDIRNGNAEAFMTRLSDFFATGDYQVMGRLEIYLQNTLNVIFNLMGLYVEVERHTTNGRMDMVIQTPDYVYIIELKIDQTAAVALQQIEDRGYANAFAGDARKLFKIGINFSSEKKLIDDWTIR